MDNVEEIKSVDELRKAQAAAQAQGTSITNYSQWEQILEDLDTVGIQSTGSFTGDVKLHEDLMKQVEEVALQIQEMQQQEQSQSKNEESYSLVINSFEHRVICYPRDLGFSVRPVMK